MRKRRHAHPFQHCALRACPGVSVSGTRHPGSMCEVDVSTFLAQMRKRVLSIHHRVSNRQRMNSNPGSAADTVLHSCSPSRSQQPRNIQMLRERKNQRIIPPIGSPSQRQALPARGGLSSTPPAPTPTSRHTLAALSPRSHPGMETVKSP